MAKHYVTFGQIHTHELKGHLIDKDCVVYYEAADSEEGRALAFGLFGDQFFTDYHEDEFDMEDLKYFPRGIINLEEPNNV